MYSSVKQIEDSENIPENIMGDIYKRQKKLHERYMKIEGLPEFIEPDSIKGQVIIKDYLWRITEELGEAYEVHEDLKHDFDEDMAMHRFEELIDAFTFLVELKMMLKIEHSDAVFKLENDTLSVINITWNIVYNLCLAGNCLKNKPWKQTNINTDKHKLNVYILRAFGTLVTYMFALGKTKEDIWQMYRKKNMVNLSRQESNY